MPSKPVWLGFKGKDRPPLGGEVIWEKRQCLWSLSKWGAFAHLGSGGENEWEDACDADRHTCRWIISQQGQVLYHHSSPLHPTTHVDSEAWRYEMDCAAAPVWVNGDGLIFMFFRQHWIKNNWRKTLKTNKRQVWSSGKAKQENETQFCRASEVKCYFKILRWH